MDVWIRSMTGWVHRARLPALSYDLPLWGSTFTESGTVAVPGEINDYKGDWLIAHGRPYVITGCTPKNGVTTISVKLPETAFSRPLVYSGAGTERYGQFIAATLESEYVEQSDALYALPYLDVSNSDTTIFSFPVAEGETYTLQDVITAAASAGVYLAWTPAVSGLSISIAARQAASHSVIIGNGHYQLVGQAYTSAVVAKATVRCLDKDTGEVLSSGTYYWQHDGSVSTEAPTPRIEGEWVQLSLTGDGDKLAAAEEAMADNSSAYKVEFYGDREDLQLGDAVRCRIGEILTEGVLSCARRTGKDKRILYRAGTAPTTLTDKVKSGGRVSASGGSGRGAAGTPGVTFTPAVSEEGVISWSNDGGLPNPAPRSIKGPTGDTGSIGPTGPTGPQGVGVSGTTKISGTGIPGGVDVYRVDLSDGSSAGTFEVYNGQDGDALGTSVLAEISIPLAWTDSGSGYHTATPTIAVASYTRHSKIDLQPDAATLAQLRADGVEALYIENNSMALTAYAIGSAPSTALTIQCTVTESEAATPPTPTPIDPTIDAFYPVGSIYLAATSIDPNIVFGGTWVRIKDTFLLASGDTYAGGTTGGEAEHTLTGSEMPAHDHTVSPDNQGYSFNWGSGVGTVNIANAVAQAGPTSGNRLYTMQHQWNLTGVSGSTLPHNNMPPYLAIWVWQRTA